MTPLALRLRGFCFVQKITEALFIRVKAICIPGTVAFIVGILITIGKSIIVSRIPTIIPADIIASRIPGIILIADGLIYFLTSEVSIFPTFIVGRLIVLG